MSISVDASFLPPFVFESAVSLRPPQDMATDRLYRLMTTKSCVCSPACSKPTVFSSRLGFHSPACVDHCAEYEEKFCELVVNHGYGHLPKNKIWSFAEIKEWVATKPTLFAILESNATRGRPFLDLIKMLLTVRPELGCD